MYKGGYACVGEMNMSVDISADDFLVSLVSRRYTCYVSELLFTVWYCQMYCSCHVARLPALSQILAGRGPCW